MTERDHGDAPRLSAFEIETALKNFTGGTEREQFLANRLTCIGGSDAASLFNEGSYGCLRRLFYSKLDIPQDSPIDDLPIIRRGQRLEDVAADEFAIKSERTVTKVGLVRHPDHPEIGSHQDRVEYSSHRSDPGTVEIKVLGRETFAKLKREGIPVDYQMQVQHGCLASGNQWGTFVAFWADGFELLSWDLDRDDELCEMIRAASVDVWAQIHAVPCEMPERLPVDDKRCARCQWRRTCQDARLMEIMDTAPEDQPGFDPDIAALAAEYEDASQVAKEADELKDAIGQQLKTALGDRQVVDTVGYRVYYRAAMRNGIDTTRLKKEQPEIAAAYNKPTAYRSMRVFAKGNR